jgi:hypothetical protein
MALQRRTTTLSSYSEIMVTTYKITNPRWSQSTFLLPWKLKFRSFWSSWLPENTANILSPSETGGTHWWWTQSLKLWGFIPYWHSWSPESTSCNILFLSERKFCVEVYYYFLKIYIGHFFMFMSNVHQIWFSCFVYKQ